MTFGIFRVNWYIFTRFGMLYQENLATLLWRRGLHSGIIFDYKDMDREIESTSVNAQFFWLKRKELFILVHELV
jgi:hypothetical protein